MKHQSSHLIVISAILIIACNNSKNTMGETAIDSVSTIPLAAMIIPESDDTIYANGRRNIFLVNRREQTGFFVERAIFPSGYKSNPHTHSGNLYATVITGAMNLALKSNTDSTLDIKVYGPGSFIIIPAHQTHFEWFTETTVMDMTGVGPLSTVNSPIVHSTQ
jgi:quercetin dioxygenase-like cupin family protein